jgi:hypothetical protein
MNDLNPKMKRSTIDRARPVHNLNGQDAGTKANMTIELQSLCGACSTITESGNS